MQFCHAFRIAGVRVNTELYRSSSISGIPAKPSDVRGLLLNLWHQRIWVSAGFEDYMKTGNIVAVNSM